MTGKFSCLLAVTNIQVYRDAEESIKVRIFATHTSAEKLHSSALVIDLSQIIYV